MTKLDKTYVSTDEREIFSDGNINSTPFAKGTIGNVLPFYVNTAIASVVKQYNSHCMH